MALYRWLQVTFPLTAATVVFAYTAWWIADRGRIQNDTSMPREQAPPNEPKVAGSLKFLRFMGAKRSVEQLPTHEPKMLAGM